MLNQFLSWRRRRSSAEQPTFGLVHGAEPVVADLATGVVDRHDLEHRLRMLPRQQRAVIVLRYYEDLDDKAIGDLLDCSAATVRAHASRALSRLRADRSTDRAIDGDMA